LAKFQRICYISFFKVLHVSLKGNPVQIGDGPAAVTGDKFRNNATVFNGKARNKDEPEVRRPTLKIMLYDRRGQVIML